MCLYKMMAILLAILYDAGKIKNIFDIEHDPDRRRTCLIYFIDFILILCINHQWYNSVLTYNWSWNPVNVSIFAYNSDTIVY